MVGTCIDHMTTGLSSTKFPRVRCLWVMIQHDVADGIKTERPDRHGAVGQGIDPEYVAREPVGRERWVGMAGSIGTKAF